MPVITSRQNPRIKEWMQLAKKPKGGRVLIEGVHLLGEALDTGVEIETIIYVPRRMDVEVEQLLAVAGQRKVEIVEVSEDCFKKFSQLNSCEKIALVIRRQDLTLNDFLDGCRKVVLLENVQDPGNAGAIVRVAEAAGADGCLFLGGVSGNNGKFLRAAMGAAFRLPCVWAAAEDFYAALPVRDIDLFVTELDSSAVSFREAEYDFSADRITAVCFGSEGKGISEELKSRARQSIYIPMAGKVESLNVAVAAGIVLYHVFFRV